MPGALDPDDYAGTVSLGPPHSPTGRPKVKLRARPGPGAFDAHMWLTYQTGKFACTAPIPLRDLQDVRLRLARSERWLTSQHQPELKRKIKVPPYLFKTSLIVTDANGNKLAEGPVRGNIMVPETFEDPDEMVVLWFRMHLPQRLGRRARPGSYLSTKL